MLHFYELNDARYFEQTVALLPFFCNYSSNKNMRYNKTYLVLLQIFYVLQQTLLCSTTNIVVIIGVFQTQAATFVTLEICDREFEISK